MSAPALPRDVAKLREQLLKDQAPSARVRTEYFDPSVIASRYGRPYSSQRLPISTLSEMRTDAILRFAQLTALVSIFTAKWRIECVAEDQRVLMADGSLKSVQDVQPGDEVLSSDGESIVRDPVSRAWSVGKRECFKITFSDGREIVVTGNHPIYGWRGWKFAGDLQPGDPVCFAHETPDQSGDLSGEDAFLLALWLAEGSKTKASYEVCCGTPGVLERLREISDQRGWNYTSMRDGIIALVGARWRREGDTPKNLLRQHGCWGQTTANIAVPDAVMSASREVVAEFLATYVACDGCATSTGLRIITTSERMARDLQILFARIGAHAYVQSRQPNERRHSLQWFVVVGSVGAKRLTDLAYVYGKQDRILAAIRDHGREDVVPPEWFAELPKPEYAGIGRPATALKAIRESGLNPRQGSWASLRLAAGSATACGASMLAERLDGQLAWTRVERVESVGEQQTYDLEVADNHTFFVDGVLTHNCRSARKAAFLDEALRKIIGRLIVQFYESWNFGWQALVKEFGQMSPGWVFIDREAEGGPQARPVWDGGAEVPALVWEPFVPLRPASVSPVWTANGAFNGIALEKKGVSGAYSVPTTSLSPGDVIDIPRDMIAYFNDKDDTQRKVDVEHSLWVVNERDGQWGSVWGFPRLGYAFKYWWSAEMALGILNRSVERKGDPTIVVTYPQGSSRIGNEDVPNQTIAFDIGNKARSGSVLAVPSEVWGDDAGTSNQAPKWTITYLKAEENFDKLREVLSYFDTMKFRSMFVSELALAEGSGGTSSRNVAAVTGERTAEAQIFTQTEWDEIINRYMIPQLADANFPELKDEPARKVTQAFGENEANLAADILRSFANADPTKLPLKLPNLLERFQIDSLEGEELAKWEQRLIVQAEAAPPAPAPASPNGNAGTTDTGFYYDARDLIQLEDDVLLAGLPKTKHYADRAVLAQTRLVRRTWHGLLSAQYEDFAEHVSKLELAETKSEKIVGAWRYTASKYAAAVKTIAAAMGKIFARAGALELSSSRLDSSLFDPTDKTMSAWVRDNVALMVRDVEETTRKQLTDFIAPRMSAGASAETIAADIREHFADFPDWRADLIAREEPRRFYNAATLFAAEAADVEQVQALDAQTGPTDAECERRHGRLFSISDAWSESVREHVRGTLSWRIIPPRVQLSSAYVSREEAEGIAARVDPESRVIYLVEELAPDVEGRYLEQVVSWFIATH